MSRKHHHGAWPCFVRHHDMQDRAALSLSAIDLAIDARIAEELAHDAVCVAQSARYRSMDRTRATHRANHFARISAVMALLAWLAFASLPGCAMTVEPSPGYCDRARDLGCDWAESCVESGESACDVIDPDACLDALEAGMTCDLSVSDACREACR